MINYDELRERIGKEFYANGYKAGYDEAKRIYSAPKMAVWRLTKDNNGDRYCSNCHAISGFYNQGNYCQFCGAKMYQYQTPDGFRSVTTTKPILYYEKE